jgi:2-polyprenyl-6-hydroxyphenyl methylase/3-demethylubiquinone-9 3-methyltransferase
MGGYYEDKLSAERLRRCYQIAPPRVQRYLQAEIDYLVEQLRPGDLVLELGCGYGRVLPPLAERVGLLVGIDSSLASLLSGQDTLKTFSNCHLACMNAVKLAFPDQSFDCIVCIQNGISAFHVNQKELIKESIRVAKLEGRILFSTYSDKFWEDRLEWFRLQSEAGLVGEIDWEKTKDGEIVCKDGFTATTLSREQFLSLVEGLNVRAKMVEVDESSLFCEMVRW